MPPPVFPAVNIYLYPDVGGSPDGAHHILLGTQFVIENLNLIELYSLNVSGTVPVTTGSTYWLELKPADRETSWLGLSHCLT